MFLKTGKLFREVSTNQICCFLYDKDRDYYDFIQEIRSRGYNQCIVSSDIMLKMLQFFIIERKAELTSIELMSKNDEIDNEVKSVLKQLKHNIGYWTILKEMLSSISKDSSIEIKKIHFRITKGTEVFFSIQANGIITITETAFCNISDKVSKIIGEYLYGGEANNIVKEEPSYREISNISWDGPYNDAKDDAVPYCSVCDEEIKEEHWSFCPSCGIKLIWQD